MGRILGPFVSLCLAALLVCFVPATAPAAHAGDRWKPAHGASFNIPRSTYTAMFRTEKRIVDAIDHAKANSRILISTYSFDRLPVADALIAAHRRGVKVQILLNNHQWTRAMTRLRNALGGNRSRSSYMYVCSFGCRTDGENLHSKFYLFGNTGASRYVTMTGSYNLTGNAARNQWNDLFTVRGNEKVWTKMASLFAEMSKDQNVADPYKVMRADGQYYWHVFPFRNFSATNDPVMTELNRIDCHGSTINGGRTVVRLNMAVIDDYRGEYLARKIRSLFAGGCDVRVLYGVATKEIREIFATKTKRGYVPVHISGYDTDYDGDMDLYGHEKTFMVSGKVGNLTAARIVFTSSGNWTTNGILGDELLFRIRGYGAMKSYKDHFDYMWANGSRLAGYIPYGNRRVAYTPADAPQPSLTGPAWEND